VSDETAGTESVLDGPGAGVDPVATGVALAGASREDANAFLKKQGALIDDQRHHLREQFKALRLGIWERRVGVVLRVATLCVGIGVAAGAGLMVWDAAHSQGLLIEPFSVPPDMAEKGLTGQVVASQVLDKLTTMDAATLSFRPPLSYANNWGKDIKVEIPETGVSIGEFRRFLREWLGHDAHISGEVWRTDTGIVISARTGGERGATFSGPQSDFDALVQKTAEHVYDQTQPYRYATYTRGQGRFDEARTNFLRLTESGSQLEKGWAWQGIATVPTQAGSPDRNTARALRKAIAAYPDYTLAYTSLAGAESNMGHSEAALADARIVQQLLDRSSIPDVDPVFVGLVRKAWAWRLPLILGDYSKVIALTTSGLEIPDQAAQREAMRQGRAQALALRHEGTAALAFMRQFPPAGLSGMARRVIIGMRIGAASEDWKDVLASESEIERAIEAAAKSPAGGAQLDPADTRLVAVYPWLALAKAKLGDVAGAQTIVAATPLDCYDCVRSRGMVAALSNQPARADYWFVSALQTAPSLPFAYTDWGEALLARGKPDAAIDNFQTANKKGPHFADPLEMWGEALMAKNQSHLALEKFAEAEKYAPNWGRLHLKWGEALVYAGKKDDAKAQFARAAQLDLTTTDKAELSRASHG
jgi:tetratricopeptide (TPR) repeat protein